MPTYTYRCIDCDMEVIKECKISEMQDEEVCPLCSGLAKRELQPTNFKQVKYVDSKGRIWNGVQE